MNDWGSVIGALTGVVALIISIMSYRYTKKTNDETISLKRDEVINDITIQFEKLPFLIKEANYSKKANLAAKGLFNSGHMAAWAQSLSGLESRLEAHKKEFEDILKLENDRILQLKKLDRLKKVLQEHCNWLNSSLKEDREEVLNRS